MRFCLLILFAFNVASGADLKCLDKPKRDEFVTIQSDKSGKWIVIGPTAITVTETARIESTTVGTSSVNFRKIITGDEGKTCHFVGPPGPYAVIQVVPDEDTPSHLVVTIPGKPDPQPDPDPPKPAPTDTAKVVIVEESANRTPKQAAVFFQLRGEKLPAGTPPVLVIDKDTSNPELKVIVAAVGSATLPVVCFVDKDGKVTRQVPLPDTFDGFRTLIGGK